MPSEEMTIGEVMRRLKEIAEGQKAAADSQQRGMDHLLAEIREERRSNAQIYALREVNDRDIAGIINDVADIRADRRRDEDRARQFQLWLIGLSVTTMLAVGGILFNFVTARGGA